MGFYCCCTRSCIICKENSISTLLLVSAETLHKVVEALVWWPLPFECMPGLLLHPCQLLPWAHAAGVDGTGRSAELGDWHSCICSFRSLMLQFHTSVSQHFLIVSYKVLQLSLSNLSRFSQSSWRGWLVWYQDEIFYLPPSLCFFSAKGKLMVLTLPGVEEQMLFLKDFTAEFRNWPCLPSLLTVKVAVYGELDLSILKVSQRA